jgi:hypothetical protein
MNWQTKLDDLKRRASTQTRDTTADARKILDTMGSIIPDVRTSKVTKDAVESFSATVERRGIDPQQSSVTTHGWLLLLSRVTTDVGHMWHLSASLFPRGRSSKTNDWKMLGHFVMYLGAPKDPMIMPEDPTRVIHWQWLEAVS